jgi:enoyl-CoA hydratase/carnithine racemase
MPGLKFGLVLGSRRFAEIVGADIARGILEETRTFDVHQAASMDFVHQVANQDQWPEIVDQAIQRADSLSLETRMQLGHALHGGMWDQDLAHLVRSASLPGLRQRILSYLQASKKPEK